MRPIIVAEIGASANGSFDRALALIDAAKQAGADAVKLQTYRPDTMVADKTFVIPDGPWAGKRLYDLYLEAQTPWSWQPSLFDYCKNIGIECFSTPFDETAVDFLEHLHCPRYKIASFEITDLPLIRKVASTGKPMIISAGMATYDEIQQAVFVAKESGAIDITLLKCTSAYPARDSDMHLRTLQEYRTITPRIGLSDHTVGEMAAVVATCLGASLIEKHIKLDYDAGHDSKFAATPNQFRLLVQAVIQASDCLGGIQYGPTGSEKSSLSLRRSIYAVESIKAGDALLESKVKLRRPGAGLSPDHLPEVLNRRASVDIPAGTPIAWSMIR